jgi:hypothetical protein
MYGSRTGRNQYTCQEVARTTTCERFAIVHQRYPFSCFAVDYIDSDSSHKNRQRNKKQASQFGSPNCDARRAAIPLSGLWFLADGAQWAASFCAWGSVCICLVSCCLCLQLARAGGHATSFCGGGPNFEARRLEDDVWASCSCLANHIKVSWRPALHTSSLAGGGPLCARCSVASSPIIALRVRMLGHAGHPDAFRREGAIRLWRSCTLPGAAELVL